jgi:hypothetical protein
MSKSSLDSRRGNNGAHRCLPAEWFGFRAVSGARRKVRGVLCCPHRPPSLAQPGLPASPGRLAAPRRPPLAGWAQAGILPPEIQLEEFVLLTPSRLGCSSLIDYGGGVVTRFRRCEMTCLARQPTLLNIENQRLEAGFGVFRHSPGRVQRRKGGRCGTGGIQSTAQGEYVPLARTMAENRAGTVARS